LAIGPTPTLYLKSHSIALVLFFSLRKNEDGSRIVFAPTQGFTMLAEEIWLFWGALLNRCGKYKRSQNVSRFDMRNGE
jgi:hypothetical protein